MLVRTILPDDAEQFLYLCLRLDNETPFMLLEPGERTASVAEQRARIEELLRRDNSTIFVAEHDGQLVGYLGAEGGYFKRNHCNVYIVVGILKSFSGQGLGTRLFIMLEEWARQRHLHRLELTVMTHNQAGIALYTKRGFTIEGTRKQALCIDGQYIDEYYMAKLLDEGVVIR
jgi:RimJ/RimL family protein N-acetyltransferase